MSHRQASPEGHHAGRTGHWISHRGNPAGDPMTHNMRMIGLLDDYTVTDVRALIHAARGRYLLNHTVNYPAQMRRDPNSHAYAVYLIAAAIRETHQGEGYPVMSAADAGCYVEGWWGQYAVAHMIQRATEFGYRDADLEDYAARHLASMGPSDAPGITDDEHEAMTDGADEVEAWLNTYARPDGHSWGWHEGEFYLWSDETWDQDS